MARDRDEPTVTVPVSLFSDMQETATKAAASGARVATTLVRLADQGDRMVPILARVTALAEDAVDARVAAARQEGFDAGLAQGRAEASDAAHQAGFDAGLAQGRSEAPAAREFSVMLAEVWRNASVRKAAVVVVLAVAGLLTAELANAHALLGKLGLVVGSP